MDIPTGHPAPDASNGPAQAGGPPGSEAFPGGSHPVRPAEPPARKASYFVGFKELLDMIKLDPHIELHA